MVRRPRFLNKQKPELFCSLSISLCMVSVGLKLIQRLNAKLLHGFPPSFWFSVKDFRSKKIKNVLSCNYVKVLS